MENEKETNETSLQTEGDRERDTREGRHQGGKTKEEKPLNYDGTRSLEQEVKGDKGGTSEAKENKSRWKKKCCKNEEPGQLSLLGNHNGIGSLNEQSRMETKGTRRALL